MKTNHENLLPSGSVSLATSRNLEPIWVNQSVVAAIQLIFTGTPDGTFKLQGSCDKGNINAQARTSTSQQLGVTNWTDIASSTVTVSAAGDVMYNIEEMGYQWVRIVWTASSAGSTPVLTVAQAIIKGV